MKSSTNVLEHPYVTRVKMMLNPVINSPVLTIKDEYQPSQGSLIKDVAFSDYASKFRS